MYVVDEVSKFAIKKVGNEFKVGVWDSHLMIYNMVLYSDCNAKTLKESIAKVSSKHKGGS